MPITSTTSASQSTLQQIQLQQAQRSVDQAEQRARSLQAQASSAQAAADQAQADASYLRSSATQAQSAAEQANQWLQTTKSLGQAGTRINSTVTQVAQRQATAPVNTPAPQPVINTQGQTLGTVINTTA